MNDLLAAIEIAHTRLTDCAANSLDHGPRHWRDVARVGLGLWAEGVDCDTRLVVLFAALHDTQRHNEYTDPGHGPRAAALLDTLVAEGVIDLVDDDHATLREALADHDKGRTSPDPTIAACWDADRLTLPRVGITPDPAYLSTDAAKSSTTRQMAAHLIADKDTDTTWEEICAAQADATAPDVLHPLIPRGSGVSADYRRIRAAYGDDLHPILEAHRVDNGAFPMVCHPLVHTMHIPGPGNVHMNMMFEQKLRLTREAIEAKNWSKLLILVERPYRLEWFIEYAHHDLLISDPKTWWELFIDTWTDTENLWQFQEEWEELLRGAPADRTGAMSPEELDVLGTLPETVTIYRGSSAPDGMGGGLSWTLDEEKAIWFARRFGREDTVSYLHTGRVSKEHILAYSAARGEEEIIALPENVDVIDTRRLD